MNDDDTTSTTEPPGVSRRDMLRRSALVGGALVWTAPAVQTLASPAFAVAGSDTPGENQCVYTAFVKYDLDTDQFSGSEGEGNATCALEQCAQSNVTVSSTGSLSSGGTLIGTVSAVEGPGNCVTLDFTWVNQSCNIDESSSYFVFKDGNDTGTGGSGCEPDDQGLLTSVTLNATGDVYQICGGTGPGEGLSHINLCICIKCPVA